MPEAHRLVGHVASSPLARLRTISFEPRRKEIAREALEKISHWSSAENIRYGCGVAIVDEWLDGSITMSRGFRMEEVWHLRHLLLVWALDWLRTFEEMSEEISAALDRANEWIGEHGPPGTPLLPINWRSLRVAREEEAR